MTNFDTEINTEQLKQNKAIALEVSRAIMNGEWKKLDELLASEFTYDGDGMHLNRDEYIGFMQDLYLAMRDMNMEFPQVCAEGDLVSIRFVNPMKNLGKFMGAPATGKTIISEGIFIRQIRNGKVIKENQTTDLIGIMSQMGFGALMGYAIAVGLLKIKQNPPVRKSLDEMKILDVAMKNK